MPGCRSRHPSLSASDPRGRRWVRASVRSASVRRARVRPSVGPSCVRPPGRAVDSCARCAFFDSACRFQQRALGCVLQVKRGGSGRAQDASVREHPNACAHPNACGSQESPPGRAVDSCARCAFFDSAHRFQQRAQESAAHPRLSSARRVQQRAQDSAAREGCRSAPAPARPRPSGADDDVLGLFAGEQVGDLAAHERGDPRMHGARVSADVGRDQHPGR